MPWILLLIAALFEIAWATGLKFSEGFTRLWPTIGTLVALVASLACLGLAVRSIPIGTAYAIWTGIGAAGTVIIGLLYFNEPMSAARLVSVGFILIGIIGLKLC